ncbi:hypothetical protein NZD89_26985 [Alicyclobacillus fastidiosus]|uniref:Big-1 domain-containing protein n=1 Tax=Alicyclobacillus fastidiosus TaxID=392011 RepID=A0ABY6ZFV7_9BACL|nr:hypothetical protein [Alicyclobacillus fastidiosus]WAH41805.1 hypothetical protein NZD89_26985 [Alicyclobacillus fastidiosus]
MKRALTGIAAAAVVLGSVSPMAFAATTTSGLTKAGQLPIVVNGSVLSNPYEMTGKDSGNTTAFFPVYYFNQALAKIGYTATWDGTTHTWAITAPGVTAAPVAGGVGTGNTTITVNGTVVKKINTQAAKDPAASKSAAATTYLPAYYVDEILTAIGAQGTFSGQTGLKITGAAQGEAGLSAIAVTGQTSGTGSTASPATALNGGSLTLSTTLTDANGNPLANTQVTFAISAGGSYASGLSVTSNGDAVASSNSGVVGATAADYQVYTNASGVASINVTGPSGQTAAYSVTASAPYQTSTGATLSTSAVNVEFVAPGSVGISPYVSGGAYDASFGTAQPVTVTLPPANGVAQSNVTLTFNVDNGYFTNSAGADLGQEVTAQTNASGQATVYVNDSVLGQTSNVTVTGSTPTLTVNTGTSIEWNQAGTASSINNFAVSNTNPTAGQDVTLTGTVVDANGNAVPNAQLLLVGGYNSNNATNAYVSNGTTTDFPNVTIAQGVPANSNYGEVLTTNAAGVFTATVTDSSSEIDGYAFYPVVNGVVSQNQPLNYSATASAAANSQSTAADDEAGDFTTSVTFGDATTLANITAYGILPSSVSATDSTSVSGINAGEGDVATAYFAPVSASTVLSGQALSYNLSASNSGTINQVDGVNLLNAVSATTATVTYYASTTSGATTYNPYYLITVPGGFAGGYTSLQINGSVAGGTNATVTGAKVINAPLTSTPELLSVGVSNKNTGTTNLTVTSGSAQATAAFGFTNGAVNKLASVSPVSGSITSGQSSTFNFTVEDSQGNPIANTSVPVAIEGSNSPVWITVCFVKKISLVLSSLFPWCNHRFFPGVIN